MRLLNKSKLKIQSKVLKTFQYPPLFGPMRFMMPFCWSNFKLYFTPRSRRTHTTPRQVWRRLLQESGRIPRTSCHLQGPLHNQAAQPPYRPARCRHGFACRPHRRRHPLGHIQACARIGMESRMPALGAQQPDMDKADELPRGMARLPRYMVEDAGLRRHARSGRGQRQRGWQTWSEESARRSARLVQRSPA